MVLWPLLAALSLLAGCDNSPVSEEPALLRIGLLPDRSKSKVREHHHDLAEYLSREIGIPVELVVADSYEASVEDFVAGRTHLARFGAFTFLHARQRCELVPIVMRDVDRYFSSVFLVQAKDKERPMSDFRAERLAFGSRFSTSGHLMPRHFLTQAGINPDEFFSSVTYTGNHEATARKVQDGQVEIGALNAIVAEQMFEQGDLDPALVSILQETPPFTDYCWVARGDLPKTLIEEIEAAFLRLSRLDPEHASILNARGAGAYLPVRLADFEMVERALTSLPPDHPAHQEGSTP